MTADNVVKLILGILFILCLTDQSYGYYQFVRTAGLIGFLWLFFQERSGLYKWLWLFSATLINPIFKIPLGRQLWNAVDIAWIIIFILSVIKDNNET